MLLTEPLAIQTAQGSGTVTMITVSAILKPLVDASPPSHHVVFWIFRTMTGLTEVETLKTRSVMMAVLGFTAMAITLLASRLLPLV